mgnify:CR=1 FL=1
MAKANAKVIILTALLAIIGLLLLVILLTIAFTGLPFASAGNKIVIIPIEGELTMEKESPFGKKPIVEILENIEKARLDPNVKAVILEINSPGGSIVAANQIIDGIKSLKESKKKVVAYISEIGTSAAYYVAASCDYIIADEDSFTGSIGVIAIIPNIVGFMKDWGIEVEILKEGKFKAMGNIFQKMSEEEKAIWQSLLKEAYQNFKRKIVEFRKEKLNKTEFEKIADGRILSGRQALKIGLIDEVGTKKYAIKKTAELANIKEPEVEDLSSKEVSLFDLLAGAGSAVGDGLKKALAKNSFAKLR